MCGNDAFQKALKSVLIKDLRGSDIHGAPLLFQAVKGGDIGCFDVLRTEIRQTLGKGEVNDQLCARDKMNRTIIMCVADSDNDSPKMFEHLTQVLIDVKPRESEASRQTASTPHWYLGYKDDKDMTLLHLVARFGKKGTFEAVLDAYGDLTNRSLFEEHLNAPDKKGRTPLMHLLRNKFNYKNNNSDEDTEVMLDKMGAILSRFDLEKQLKDSWETEVRVVRRSFDGGVSNVRLSIDAHLISVYLCLVMKLLEWMERMLLRYTDAIAPIDASFSPIYT